MPWNPPKRPPLVRLAPLWKCWSRDRRFWWSCLAIGLSSRSLRACVVPRRPGRRGISRNPGGGGCASSTDVANEPNREVVTTLAGSSGNALLGQAMSLHTIVSAVAIFKARLLAWARKTIFFGAKPNCRSDGRCVLRLMGRDSFLYPPVF
jgi:hypothetical protein